MATLSELQTEVAEEIGSINTSTDATKLTRQLNRGVRHVLRHTHCYVTAATMTAGAAADAYTLPAAVLDIVEFQASDSSGNVDLERLSRVNLLRMRNAESVSGSPTRYYAFTGSNLVMFHPTPTASSTFTLYYVPVPTAMSSASHDPSNTTYGGVPDDYHELVALYAMWKLASYDDDQSSAQGERYRTELERGIARARAELHRKGGHRLPRATVGGRRSVSGDPSVVIWR